MFKKKKLNVFFCLLTLIMSIFFCGCESSMLNQDSDSKDKSTNNSKSDDDNSTSNKRKKESKESKEKRKKTEKVDYTGGTNTTWFDEQGLTFTKMGEFKAKFSGYNDYDDIREMPADCWMYDSYEGCEDGYKNIITVINIYTKDSGEVQWWTSYFDGYTGQSFEFNTTSTSVYNGAHFEYTGTANLAILGSEYDLDILYEIEQTDYVITETFTFTVPASYDGLVIQIGQSSELYDKNRDKYKIGKETYYADEFTDMKDKYDYFSLMSNKK